MENKLYVPSAPIFKFIFQSGLTTFEVNEICYIKAFEKLYRIIEGSKIENKKPILLKVIEL